MRYFKVSGTGNGIGVIVIRTESGQEVILRVHPKVWRKASSHGPALRRLNTGDSRSITTVYEMDLLEVSDDIADAFKACRQLVLTAEEKLLEDDAEVSSPLLTEVMAPRVAVAADPQADSDLTSLWDDDRAMWKLIGTMDHLSLENSGDLPAVLGSAAIQRQPELRKLFLEEFTKLAITAIRYQKPEFRRTAGPLMAIRGKVLIEKLVLRKAYRHLTISCEYTDLSADNLLWKTIRAALRQCLAELEDSVPRSHAARERALQADAHLSSVTVASPYTVLQQAPLTHHDLPRGAPHDAYLAARAVLSHAIGLGTAAGQDSAGISIKIVTAHLWEEMLRRRFISAGYVVEDSSSDLHLFRKTLLSKRPDIELRDASGALLVIDAKYKVLSALQVGKMAMLDQYQMYAYATQRRCRTIFIHVGDPGCAWTSSAPVSSSEETYRVGIASLPFPSPRSLLAANGLGEGEAAESYIPALEIPLEMELPR